MKNKQKGLQPLSDIINALLSLHSLLYLANRFKWLEKKIKSKKLHGFFVNCLSLRKAVEIAVLLFGTLE